MYIQENIQKFAKRGIVITSVYRNNYNTGNSTRTYSEHFGISVMYNTATNENAGVQVDGMDLQIFNKPRGDNTPLDIRYNLWKA